MLNKLAALPLSRLLLFSLAPLACVFSFCALYFGLAGGGHEIASGFGIILAALFLYGAVMYGLISGVNKGSRIAAVIASIGLLAQSIIAAYGCAVFAPAILYNRMPQGLIYLLPAALSAAGLALSLYTLTRVVRR